MPTRHSSPQDGASWPQSCGALWFLVCIGALAVLGSFYVDFVKLTALAGRRSLMAKRPCRLLGGAAA